MRVSVKHPRPEDHSIDPQSHLSHYGFRDFLRRHLVSDSPPDTDLCLDCGKLVCSEDEFVHCVQRIDHAAELMAAIRSQE
jgi:hypothetical protein